MRRFVRAAALCLDILLAAVMSAALSLQATLPDSYHAVAGEAISFDYPIRIVYLEGQPAAASAGGSCLQADLRLFGAVRLKTVEISVDERKTVLVSGVPFGIKMFTDGLMVVGMSDVPTEGGRVNPSREAGVEIGDMIETADGARLTSNEHLGKVVAASDGKPVVLGLRRSGKTLSVTVQPALSRADGRYHIGVWVRDSSAGIGTLTFCDPNSGVFTGLGHPICDIDTGSVMPLENGEVVLAEITGCKAGQAGAPGELKGRFLEKEPLGSLMTNCQTGVYGMLSDRALGTGTLMPVAAASEVHPGDAEILTTVSGTQPKRYKVKIEKVLSAENSRGQNMILRVTDPTLLEITGGIVQGMSGSPIIQDGMLAGAVTHVFVNDPTRGYGIFSENVISDMNGLIASIRLSLRV